MSNQHCNSDDCHSGVCVRTVLHGDLVTVLRFPDSSTHRSQFQLPRAAIETLILSRCVSQKTVRYCVDQCWLYVEWEWCSCSCEGRVMNINDQYSKTDLSRPPQKQCGNGSGPWGRYQWLNILAWNRVMYRPSVSGFLNVWMDGLSEGFNDRLTLYCDIL